MYDTKSYLQNIDETVAYLKSRISCIPDAAIVLGSGLGKLGDRIENPTVIPYKDIPHFKTSTATGHKGNLIFGKLGNKDVVAMQGRFHFYEGYTMQEVTLPIRVFAKLGIKRLFVSNAAGGVNPDLHVGDLMIITDHINRMPNPLVGPNMEEFGTRFPDMTTVYSKAIRTVAHAEARNMGIEMKEGVYLASTGPTYETPAEYRYFHIIGADAVGMSTVPEVIVARHSGLEIFGMSVITNEAAALSDTCLNDGNDVVVAADRAADRMTELFTRIIGKL
ncbi:MAG: purine nucleoside phosphorylase I, inosine and guanosine-specific [Bacteroidales bacterium]|nr:purine nucleoside phosphorylase I, inosine and guanosine-specific [Bacteroidales bacterium]